MPTNETFEKVSFEKNEPVQTETLMCESDYLLFPETGIQFDEIISILDDEESKHKIEVALS